MVNECLEGRALSKAHKIRRQMKNKFRYRSLNNIRENTLALVRHFFSFELAVGENFSQHNSIVLHGIDSKNRWQGNQRQEQALSMELINGVFNDQPANRNSHQQTNRIP